MKIDVIVPIYNAYDAVKNCLLSLEKHNSGNVILINDASTDVRIDKLTQQFSLKNDWKLIIHDRNKGFVKTANEGLKLTRGNSILLNSDTIVSKHWLDAFKELCKNNKDVGTATALSNNAEICSIPKFLTNNNLPKDINRLSEILFNHYSPTYPSIPTAVGFCMLISQKAKKKVGFFDEKQFGHGYGEENDYSLRVVKAGLKNIVCDNAYVAHIGNESFSDFGIKPNEETMQRLLEKHPKYLELIQNYINKDPLSSMRHAILKTLHHHHYEFN
jgi:GT2 family glycosyltransferase